jgi:hypothetical protein
MFASLHQIIRRKLEHGDAFTVEEAREEALQQIESMQNLADQAQDLNLGYGTGDGKN